MLTPEDILKLNVLVSTSVAIRIDVYKLHVVGLTTDKNEQTIALHPNTDSTQYINEVQKLLLGKVLGTMGGYPSYLKRWSRMGQVSSSNLKSLLKLGNIEAVVAVANSQNLDDEVIDLVWWCATNTDEQAEIGRFLLTRGFVVKHAVGQSIANYLLEFLPFTENINTLIDTTNLILQDDLISKEAKDRLWKQGQRKTAFLVGFMERLADQLPNTDSTQALNCEIKELEKSCSEQGQILLKTCAQILKKINQEHVLYRTLEILGSYLSHPQIKRYDNIEKLQTQAITLAESLNLAHQEKVKACFLLSGVSERLVVSTISAHGLTGSAIRKKLGDVLVPIQDAIKLLTTP